jgi:hypothetical protein
MKMILSRTSCQTTSFVRVLCHYRELHNNFTEYYQGSEIEEGEIVGISEYALERRETHT